MIISSARSTLARLSETLVSARLAQARSFLQHEECCLAQARLTSLERDLRGYKFSLHHKVKSAWRFWEKSCRLAGAVTTSYRVHIFFFFFFSSQYFYSYHEWLISFLGIGCNLLELGCNMVIFIYSISVLLNIGIIVLLLMLTFI